MIWADEFDLYRPPNPENWGFEEGVRKEEAQWYQPESASGPDWDARFHIYRMD